ncbi:unnamed protein product, partial [marine sediment metagenome]
MQNKKQARPPVTITLEETGRLTTIIRDSFQTQIQEMKCIRN